MKTVSHHLQEPAPTNAIKLRDDVLLGYLGPNPLAFGYGYGPLFHLPLSTALGILRT